MKKLNDSQKQHSLIKGENEECFLSLYDDELTDLGIENGINRIKSAFPSLPTSFYGILIDRIAANNFGDKRLLDSINHVIETCIYPNPTIANFLNFEKKKKLYTYQEVLKFIHENGGNITESFENLKIEDKTYWQLR